VYVGGSTVTGESAGLKDEANSSLQTPLSPA
jgi:hypothetical protein